MPLIILDRDGVINQDSDSFIKSRAEFLPLPGSLDAIRRLKTAGWQVALATNQSGIARGLFDEAALQAMHDYLAELLGTTRLDAIRYCPHGPDDHCACRKPRPGMFLDLLAHFGVQQPDAVWAVGDAVRDLQAARAAGVRPLLVRTGKGASAEHAPEARGVPVFDDLAAAVDWLLTRAD